MARCCSKLILQPGFYLVHGVTHELFRDEDHDIWSCDDPFEAIDLIDEMDTTGWGILEVTADNFAWGE